MKRVIVKNGMAYPNPREDVLKIVVAERHHATGNAGIGWVQGFGLKKGAIGSSVAHDSHNIIVVGTNDPDILKAVRAIQAMGGAWSRWRMKVLASVPLPVESHVGAPVFRVHQQMEILKQSARDLRCKLLILSRPFPFSPSFRN
jgi:adenine deaminase